MEESLVIYDTKDDLPERGRGIHKPFIQKKKARNYLRKLTHRDVGQIKRALAQGEPQNLIARRYNVGKSTISDIAVGNTWQHIPVPYK